MGKIVIVGAGIIGLYTALLLTEAKLGNDITIVAKNLPGDMSSNYTSPIAGAHFSYDIAGSSKELMHWCHVSYPMLKLLFKKFENQLEDAGLERMLITEMQDTERPQEFIDSIKDHADNFRVITDKEYLADRGAVFGMQYLTFNFYTVKFLKFLKQYLESQGVQFVRANLNHLNEAPRAAGANSVSAIFNCTGVLATKLGGVVDPKKNYPIRGQVIVVRAPWIKENSGIGKVGLPATYVIPRPHSGGRVILGGYYDENDWNEASHGEQTKSIIERTTALMPELLKNGPLDILDERAGFRPGRESGPRIECEIIDGFTVIHNYGAAGTGFQNGLGMAQAGVDIYFGKPESKL